MELEVKIIFAMCYCLKSSFKKKLEKWLKTFQGVFEALVFAAYLYISQMYEKKLLFLPL